MDSSDNWDQSHSCYSLVKSLLQYAYICKTWIRLNFKSVGLFDEENFKRVYAGCVMVIIQCVYSDLGGGSRAGRGKYIIWEKQEFKPNEAEYRQGTEIGPIKMKPEIGPIKMKPGTLHYIKKKGGLMLRPHPLGAARITSVSFMTRESMKWERWAQDLPSRKLLPRLPGSIMRAHWGWSSHSPRGQLVTSWFVRKLEASVHKHGARFSGLQLVKLRSWRLAHIFQRMLKPENMHHNHIPCIKLLGWLHVKFWVGHIG